MRRRLALVAAALAFAVVAVVVARWLLADTAERAKVERLLRAQGRADVRAMAAEIEDCGAACRERLGALAERLGRPGKLEILRYDSATSHALGAESGPTRVVWRLGEGESATLPTVQCVQVTRRGSALTGPRVSLRDLSAPIGRESGC